MHTFCAQPFRTQMFNNWKNEKGQTLRNLPQNLSLKSYEFSSSSFQGSFWKMISFEFHLKNDMKSQKNAGFLVFQNQYLFRCYLLYCTAEKGIARKFLWYKRRNRTFKYPTDTFSNRHDRHPSKQRPPASAALPAQPSLELTYPHDSQRDDTDTAHNSRHG